MESGERGRRRESDESREHKEEDERSKEIDEFVERWERSREIDEFVKNWERERERETKEESKNQGDNEHPEEKEYQEDKTDHESEEHSKERENKECGEEYHEGDDEDEFSRRVDEAVRDAVRELEEEEAREDAEKQEAEERSKEPNEYDELEERMKEVFEDRGVPREEMEARWKEGQEADMEEEMEEKNEDTTSDASETKNDTEEGSTSGESAEGESYHESGEGMVYATKEGSSSETQESTTESEEESEEQKESKVQETTHEQSEESSSETRELTEQIQSTERPTSECIEDSENQETKKPSEDSEESSQRREGNESKEKRENQVESESAESKAEDTLEQSERSQEGGSSQEDEFRESESRESTYHEGDSDQDVSEKKSKQESQSESASESESSEQKETQDTENEEVHDIEEEVNEVDTEKKELDDSEPSPNFPEGFPEEPARMLPDEFNVSLFPYPDEYSEKELTEEEMEELEEFIREVEESTDYDIETVEDLKRALEENPEYYEDPMFDAYYESAVRYLEYKLKLRERYSEEELEEISHVDAARELGYTIAESSFWFNDRKVPFLIDELKKAKKRKSMVNAMREILEKKVTDALSETPKAETSKTRGELTAGWYRRKTTYPLIRDKEVRSYLEFVDAIEKHYPWVKERSDFSRLMSDAKLFFQLYEKWCKSKTVSRQSILESIGDHSVSVETVKDWVKGNSHPQIFDIIQYGLSVEEGNALADRLLAELNGINDFKSHSRIMRTLYITDLLSGHKHYDREVKRVRQYFRFLDALKHGGLHSDFARKSGAPEHTTKTWILYRTKPRYLKYACSVPKTSPGRGKRWLPLVVKESGLEAFLKVSVRIESPKDIEDTLNQLKSLDSKRMRQWAKRYQGLKGPIAFMYLLGAIFSDGGFGRKKGTTTKVSLSASKKYNWSKSFGEAFCYCLGLLGIRTSRWKDRHYTDKDGNLLVKREWGSSMSPLLSYIRKSLFGLEDHHSKSDDPMNMDWVFALNDALRLSLLQGISDGDGFASIRSFTAGIGTKANKPFIEKLLASLGIESRRYMNGLSIDSNDAIRKAEDIKIFLLADGKTRRLSELVAMLDAMDNRKIEGEEKDTIIRLKKSGLSNGQITSYLWAEYGIARRPTTIGAFLKRHGIKSK